MRVSDLIGVLTNEDDSRCVVESAKFHTVLKCCALFSLALMVVLAFDPFVWYDEVFSLSTIRFGYGDIIDIATDDTLPPLYYLMLKAWTDIFPLGSEDGFPTVVMARLFSLVAYVCTAALCWRKLKGSGIERYRWVLMLCLCSTYLMLFHGLDIRMYSWGLFFVTAVFLYACDVAHGNGGWVTWLLMALYTICAAYTHEYALISSAIIWLLVLPPIIRGGGGVR